MAAPKIQMKRKGTSLVTIETYGLEKLCSYPEEQILNVTITSAKRMGKLALYWAGLGMLLENLNELEEQHWPTTRHLHIMLMQELGFVEKLWRIDGTFKIVPNSIAIDAMDDDDFDRVLERCRQFVVDAKGFDPWDMWVEKKNAEKANKYTYRPGVDGPNE